MDDHSGDVLSASITLFVVTSALAAFLPFVSGMKSIPLSEINPFFAPIPLVSALVSLYDVLAFMTVLLAILDILRKEERPLWHLLSPLSHSISMVFYTVLLLMIANIVIVLFVAGSVPAS